MRRADGKTGMPLILITEVRKRNGGHRRQTVRGSADYATDARHLLTVIDHVRCGARSSHRPAARPTITEFAAPPDSGPSGRGSDHR